MGTAAGTSPKQVERAHHGVSFEAWAFVVAGLDDGLMEEDLLAHVGLDAERWQLASAAFHDDVLDDAEAGGTLTEAFDEAMRAARRVWSREIPPLDADLRAWLDYHRAWATAESPLEFLEAQGLRVPDIHRLEDHWREKLAADEALRKQGLAILQVPPGPVPTPKPKPPRLPAKAASVEGVDVTQEAKMRRTAAPLPFSAGPPAPSPPKLSVSLPKPQRLGRARLDETRVAVPSEAAGLVLPFLAPEPGAEEAPPRVDPASRTLRPSGDVTDEGERVALSLEMYAALCVDLIEAPSAHDLVLVRYEITAADKLALDVYWTQRMAEDVALWLAWDRACAERRAGK